MTWAEAEQRLAMFNLWIDASDDSEHASILDPHGTLIWQVYVRPAGSLDDRDIEVAIERYSARWGA